MWEAWISMYPFMQMERIPFVSFEDYKKNLMSHKHKYSKKTDEEILQEMLPIIENYERKEGGLDGNP